MTMTITTPSVTPTPVNPVWLLPGTRVGAYVIRRALDRGGGQIAYLAEGPRRRTVVLKMSIFPKGERDSDSRMMHRRFLRQVAFFLELDGVPGVAKVSAYGMHPDTSHDGHLYMVQEWVPRSRTIVDWCREEPRPLNIIVCGWVMLAAACGEMARRGICHRDLKADNVLMTSRGVPKIIDFNSGIGPGAERLTWPSSRCVPGTPSSYSPEHCEAILEEYATRRPVPFQYFPPGDLHALGVIFYQVLTGQHPFSGPKGEALYERIAHQMPERPRLLNPEVPFGLEKVTMKLLQKKPELRYQSGDQLALELEALFATGEDWSRPFRTPPRSHITAPSTTTPRPSTPQTRADRPVVIGAIVSAAPSAIVRAGPRAIVLKGPFALARLSTAEPERPRRRRRRLAVALFVAVASLLGRHAGLSVAGPADDQAWLATCSSEARRTVRELGIDPAHGDAWLANGPNVTTHDHFSGVRDGPLEATVSVPPGTEGVLAGEAQVGPAGASLRFTKLKLEGRELPVCAYGSLATGTGRLTVHFAH